MSLTEDQKRVVEHSDSFNMVCALPGSGKTHTSISITEKIRSINPNYKVCMVTFTKAAAVEMTERVTKRLGCITEGEVKCATFHSLAMFQWRSHNPRFKPIIGSDQSSYIYRALKASLFKGKFIEAVEVLDFYGQMLDPKPVKNDTENTWDLYITYKKLLDRVKGLDFSMMFRNVINGMKANEVPPLPYTHLIVDEFQDTDDVQYEWLREHARRGIKITTVGDDDQSIYGFRNSKGYEVMRRFQDEFEATGHVLSICFRCQPEILYAAQRVIEFNTERVPKKMKSNLDGGGEVSITLSEGKEDEAEKIAGIINSQPEERFAVLARNNTQLDVIERTLIEKEIPFERASKDDFWDSPQVTSFMKILYSIANPYDTRYINDMLGFLEECEDEIQVLTKAAKKNKSFGSIPEDVLTQCRAPTKKLHKHFFQIGRDTEDVVVIEKRLNTLMNWIGEAKNKKDGKGLAAANAVKKIIINNGVGTLLERIGDIVYRLRKNNTTNNDGGEEARVRFCTLHGSKGLEWPNVIIAGICNGILPSAKSVSLEEERRLLYVGMTRAEQRLYMMCYGKPSEFLLESFPDVFEDLDYVPIEEDVY